MLPELKTSKKVAMKAKVKMNMKAQIPDEMDLFQDEIVNILEEVEKGWFRGECNGRHGIFPASFVTIIDENSASNIMPINESSFNLDVNQLTYDNNHSGYDCVNSGITPYGSTLYPFKAEYPNELSFNAGEIINLIEHVDSNWIKGEIDGRIGIFPANFVNIVVDCPTSEKEKASKEQPNDIDLSLFPPDTYGRVIFDFYPQLEGDVRLKEGDTVTLMRKVDRNWYEVITDSGDTGICPENYIEVIGSGPPSYNEVMGNIYNWSNNSVTNNNSEKQLGFNSFDTNTLSFLNQNTNSFENNLNSDVTSKFLDDKISQSLKALDSSGVSSGYGSNESKSSCVSSNSFDNSNITHPKEWNDLNSSVFQTSDSYENVQEEKIRNWSSNNSNLPTFEINTGNFNAERDQTPARPPPPKNSSSSVKLSSHNSNTSLNSLRMSATSVSSHSSTDTLHEKMDIEEIRAIIQQKEKVLKLRVACKNKLENESKRNSNSFASTEMKTQLSQLDEEINRLKKEISELQADLAAQILENNKTTSEEQQSRDEEVERKRELEAQRREQEKKKKLKEQRECIITELLQTERDYISDLKLLQDTFLRNPKEAKDKGIDINTLFGNLDEVIDVASRLLRRLQKQSRDTQLIGECFVDMCGEMKEVYGHYCRNHDEVNTVVDKIDSNSAGGQYLKHKLEIMKRQTNCFDLPAMLIKPVQRILKYPLLLNELLKCTEDNHPDKQWLMQATTLMTDVAAAVNEFKRRKDLVFKYRKQADTSLSGRVSKLSIHSMAKKTSRFGMRLSTTIGLKTISKDEEFEKLGTKFNALEKSLKIFQKDILEYMKKAEELVATAFNMAEEIAELYQEKKNQQEVDQFRSTHRIILTQHWDVFKQTVERSINSPIKLLLQSFRGPTNLIQKRYDKLLDHESSTSKLEKNKDATKIKLLQENQTMAKNTYEALNSQLLDDLPKLCDLSIEILYDCIRCFLKAKKNFVGRAALLLITLMDLPLLLGSQGNSILETFQVKHTLVIDDLSRLSISPKEFDSCLKSNTLKRNSSPRGSRLSFSGNLTSKSQNSGQRVKVKSCYPQTDLYTANQNFDAVDIMDITLKKGDVVGVIKKQDPMGQNLRWFVDNGDNKGFVPAKCLVKNLPNSSVSKVSGADDWNIMQVSSPNVPTNQQDIYAQSKKALTSQSPKFPNKTTQPVRPAPVVSSSLRVVAPSRYPVNPPAPDRMSNRISSSATVTQPSVNENTSANSSEPTHRYEEIDEFSKDIIQPTSTLMDSVPVTGTKNVSKAIDEFDPYSVAKSGTELYDNVPDDVDNLYSLHRYEDIPEDSNYAEVPNDLDCENIPEYYFALYDFLPNGANQLPLKQGQVVLVLHKCDLNRNSQWWFVEDRHAQKGYVPAAYLNKYSNKAAA
ncbi:rho guanine nucleotide exchange factor 38 isoform X2 [Parasteatoda tepidariorum]|nr:dynamin-binding protein isoform X2 [Parasteatoda tepidariorum]